MSCVQSGNVAIVLVDWGQLECIWCDKLRCQVSPIFNENQSMMEFCQNMVILKKNNFKGINFHLKL